MPQKMSWDGELEKVYERLGFHGGYPRKLNHNLPSSLANSEYVKSDGVAVYVVGRAGKKLNSPIKDPSNFTPHFHNFYGRDGKNNQPGTANAMYVKDIRKRFDAKIKKLKEQARRK
jgi:hypothetical protein